MPPGTSCSWEKKLIYRNRLHTCIKQLFNKLGKQRYYSEDTSIVIFQLYEKMQDKLLSMVFVLFALQFYNGVRYSQHMLKSYE